MTYDPQFSPKSPRAVEVLAFDNVQLLDASQLPAHRRRPAEGLPTPLFALSASARLA
jgi:hypothetical protein